MCVCQGLTGGAVPVPGGSNTPLHDPSPSHPIPTPPAFATLSAYLVMPFTALVIQSLAASVKLYLCPSRDASRSGLLGSVDGTGRLGGPVFSKRPKTRETRETCETHVDCRYALHVSGGGAGIHLPSHDHPTEERQGQALEGLIVELVCCSWVYKYHLKGFGGGPRWTKVYI